MGLAPAPNPYTHPPNPTTELDPLGLAPCDPLPRPEVDDPKLRSTVEQLYRGVDRPDRIGNGTTMDAIRHELATGSKVQGKGHLEKGYAMRRNLTKWIRTHRNASSRDLLSARSLVRELNEVLPGEAVVVP